MSSIEKNPNSTGNLGATGNHFMLPLQQPGLFDPQATPSEDLRRGGNPVLSDDTPVPPERMALLVNQANLLSQGDRSFRFLVEAVTDYEFTCLIRRAAC